MTNAVAAVSIKVIFFMLAMSKLLSKLHLDNMTGGLDIGSSHAMQHTLANQHKAATGSSLLMASAFVLQGKAPDINNVQQFLRQHSKLVWLLPLTLICW